MTIKIWQSYSCNNSSSYRLVARFADPAAAQVAATELDAFFKAYAVEMDALMEASDYTFDKWPPGAIAFAKQHGFSWGRDWVLGWGDEGLTGDEPEIVVEDDVLLVYHSYCGGGLGKGVPAYLSARGASKVETDDSGSPTLTVLFPYAGGNKKLDGDLKKLSAQTDPENEQLITPWKSRGSYGSAAFYRDAKTVGMVIPFQPADLPAIRGWLTKRGITKPSIRLCESADEEKLVAIAGAKCEACGGALELWHPRLRDIETEQMACTACGGMYEIATFVAAAKKRERARARAEAKAQAQEQAAADEAAKAKKKKANSKTKTKAKTKAKTKTKTKTKKRK